MVGTYRCIYCLRFQLGMASSSFLPSSLLDLDPDFNVIESLLLGISASKVGVIATCPSHNEALDRHELCGLPLDEEAKQKPIALAARHSYPTPGKLRRYGTSISLVWRLFPCWKKRSKVSWKQDALQLLLLLTYLAPFLAHMTEASSYDRLATLQQQETSHVSNR